MIRQQLMKQSKPDPTAFRWRGGEVSRLEGFSDAVFGFAITLLVVSLEVPKTFDELAAAMRGFGGFAVCFCLLSLVWYDHYVFFRQYGLNDTLTVVLNLVLLFVVMFYVYPLKFLFTLLVSMFTGIWPATGDKPVIEGHQFPALMLIYGGGFVAVYVVFTLMYLNAYRQRESLELNELEVFDTRAMVGNNLVLISIGLISMALASVGTPKLTMASGAVYWLIGLAMAAYWTPCGRRRRKLEVRYASKISLSASSEPAVYRAGDETPPLSSSSQPVSSEPTLRELRANCVRTGGRMISLPIAGAIGWTIAGVLGCFLPVGVAAIALFICTGMVFPLGLLIAHFLDEDLLGRKGNNELDRLMGWNVLMVNLCWAIVIPFYMIEPSSLPLGVGVFAGLHWIPLSWIIQHWIGLLHAIARTMLVVAAWFLFPELRFVVIPAVVVVMYLISIFVLATRRLPK